jgi:hypothetical protein
VGELLCTLHAAQKLVGLLRDDEAATRDAVSLSLSLSLLLSLSVSPSLPLFLAPSDP